MSPADALNLTLRVAMEIGIVAALVYWGYHEGDGTVTRVLLAVCTPLIGFGLWGTVDFRRAGRAAEPLRLVQELVISGLAALALYAAGEHALGWSLAGLSLVYHALVYATGARLLGDRERRVAMERARRREEGGQTRLGIRPEP